jgi:release factor glutamine methyltransferase
MGEATAVKTEAQELAAILGHAAARIADALDLGVREARLEAQVLAAHALGVNRAWLVAHGPDALPEQAAAGISTLIHRRVAGEPVAYILGGREFFGLPLRVTRDVLIPRPETEHLVQAALDRLVPDRPWRILDLGTGSGAVAVALALHRPRSRVLAVDGSPAALTVARDNARRLGARNVHFEPGDWYAGLGVKKFDIVVANPPYVPSGDPHLGRGDLRFEPIQALAAGADGLEAIRVIVAGAPAHLVAGGWLLFEHGHDQAGAVGELMRRAGFEALVQLPDLAGIVRVSGGRRPGAGR